MIVTRRFPIRLLLLIALRVGVVAALWAGVVFGAYMFLDLTFLRIPFLPIATIGTAVAFYIGFKNNSAYDRFWEGRKIWGGIVNVSRSFAVAVGAYVDPTKSDAEALAARKDLIYRHLAWINALRLQLRKTSRFLHNPAASTKRRLEEHADHMRNDWDTELTPFLGADELAYISARQNGATHLLDKQGRELASLTENGRLDMFRQLELMSLVQEMFTLQGQCERIKNTPLPRQYAELSRVFVRVFVVLIPFGMLDVFEGHQGLSLATNIANSALMIASSALISWVFMTMEGIGDSSEDPFERSMNDVPMNALCRTIEIDLRELLGETELPEKEKPAGFVLY
ncbi:MAG: bestrophin family protein [Sandaracinaceae bacterium]